MSRLLPTIDVFRSKFVSSHANLDLFTKNIFRMSKFEYFYKYIDGVGVSIRWSYKKKLGLQIKAHFLKETLKALI